MTDVTDRQRSAPLEVFAMKDAIRGLSRWSRCFDELGEDAEPVFFGAHRRPQGVVLSFARYRRMLDLLDDYTIALEVKKRDREDTGERIKLDDFLREHGFDPSDFEDA